jgi:hypothetical protein
MFKSAVAVSLVVPVACLAFACFSFVCFALVCGACSTKAATSPADGASMPAPPAAVATAPAAPTSSAAPSSASAAVPPTPPTVAAAASVAPSDTAAGGGAEPPPPADPIPDVGVANIGMHIGGGPNDDETKDPIRRSVSPHFDDFRRCFSRAEEQDKGGTFGVDLRIGSAGGAAKVSHPRTSLKGKAFKECVVSTFEKIDFKKPRGGTTTVSYSLRFTPKKDGH